MKSIKSLLVLFSAILIASCTTDDVEDRPVIEALDAPVLVSPTNGAIYNLSVENSASLAERFVWSDANFGGDVEINYAVQMDVAGNEFAAPVVLGSVNSENQLAVSVETLNNAALFLGGIPLEATPYEVRVVSSVGSMEMLSNSIPVTISAYSTDNSKQLFLVGNASAAGWSNDNNNTPLFRDSDNENLFYYTGYFAEGEFKLLEMTGAWQPQWGLKDGNVTNSELLGEDPGAFPVTTAGYYAFTLDIENMTYTFEAYDASTATTFDVIGIVGDGTSAGWPNDDNPEPDVKMSNSDFDKHIWRAGDVILTDGPAKFRANLKWDVNWGGGANFPSGIANGDNIEVKAGTYTVWFNDITGRYSFIVQ